jgi:hypothetical protein
MGPINKSIKNHLFFDEFHKTLFAHMLQHSTKDAVILYRHRFRFIFFGGIEKISGDRKKNFFVPFRQKIMP